MNEELHWLAFRYAAGEMSPDEEERFERRLADDQSAREAVAQAVELKEGIRLVAAEPLPARRSGTRFAVRRAVVWAAGLAACLLLVVGLFWAVRTTAQRPDTPDAGNALDLMHRDTQAGAAVARTWAELRRQQAGEAPGQGVSSRGPLPESTRGETVFGAEDVTGGEVEVPQWLLTAFAAPDRTK